MTRFIAVLFGAAVYLLFLATFLYAIGFVTNLGVPKSIDSGAAGPWPEAVLINAGLLAVFALQHSVMARPSFKRWWTRFVPQSVERSTFVLCANLALLLLYWQWRPLPTPVWSVTQPLWALAVEAIAWLGWGLVLVSTFLISHFELFGLKQVFARFLGHRTPAPSFRTPLFYRYVRHPIYLGFLLAFWATPRMSVGHLLFAFGVTGYVFLGIWLEERDLIEVFGDRYRRYRREAGMLIPRLAGRGGAGSPSSDLPLNTRAP